MPTPVAISDPDTAALPDLITRAAAVYLASLSALSGLPIATEKTAADYKRPILVLQTESASERIHASGVFQVTLVATLETTHTTSDGKLERWDAAIWNHLQDTVNLPASLTASQPGLQVHAALDPSSRALVLSQKQRDIAYQIELIATKVAI